MKSQDRLHDLREAMAGLDVDGFLVAGDENRFYISGFQGSAGWLLITESTSHLITDFRYTEQACDEAPCFDVVMQREDLASGLKPILESAHVARLGFEEEHLTYRQYRRLRERIDGVEMVPFSGLVEGLRAIKDPDELENIRAAAGIAVGVMQATVGFLEVGRSEKDVSDRVEALMKEMGAQGPSFEPIVLSGPRSALPHGKPSRQRMSKGDMVLIDIGARYNCYCSDLTRTVVMGSPGKREVDVLRVAVEAQAAGIDAIRPGVTGKEVDQAARNVIGRWGYADRFGHGLGHGLGLAVHENPRLSPHAEQVLEAGMVVTVEPGIYIPGWGGVRVEDMVLVTESGAEVLTGDLDKLPIPQNRG